MKKSASNKNKMEPLSDQVVAVTSMCAGLVIVLSYTVASLM